MNHRIAVAFIAVTLVTATPALADTVLNPKTIVGQTPVAVKGGHPYDPCEMVSQQDVASAAGVATNQVFTPKRPTPNECVWAVGNRAGVPGQQFALTVQTIDQAQHARGIARFGALLNAVQSIPGVPLSSNPIVARAFADAQVVVGLGDKAGWKSGTLSVLKNETLYQVTAAGQATDSESLKAATAVAQAALNHVPSP